MKRSIFLTIILLSGVSLFAQTAIGSFRSHIAVNKFISVAVDASTIYAATEPSAATVPSPPPRTTG